MQCAPASPLRALLPLFAVQFFCWSGMFLMWIGAYPVITLAIRSVYVSDRAGTMRNLMLTMVLGSAFLGLKAREYYLDYQEGLIPKNTALTHEAEEDWKAEVARRNPATTPARSELNHRLAAMKITAQAATPRPIAHNRVPSPPSPKTRPASFSPR